MTNDYFRYYKPNILLIFIILSASLIGALVHQITPLINSSLNLNYSQYPSTGVLVGLLLLAIDQLLWKYKPFSWLFWVKDISGRYVGNIEYRHYLTGEIERKSSVIEIEQSASKVKVKCYFKSDGNICSHSKSLIVNIVADEFGNQSLVFTYQNLGSIVHKLPAHNGTNILQIIQGEEIELDGIYYTDKEPQTKGNIKCVFESKTLKHKF